MTFDPIGHIARAHEGERAWEASSPYFYNCFPTSHHTVSFSPAESMSISTLYIEAETNPVITPFVGTPPLGDPTLLQPHADGTLTVWVRTPLNSRVGVYKVTEFESSIFLEEMIRY